MLQRSLLCAFAVMLMASATSAQPPDNPVVTMNVTLPEGKTVELAARDSGLATTTLTDGTAYGFRPTIQDSAPWNHTVITIFKMDPAVETLGEVEARTGAGAVASKTKPVFRIAVSKVAKAPAASATTP